MANTSTSIQFLLLVLLSSGFHHFETLKFCSCNDSHNISCLEVESKALLKFKGGLRDPSGRLSSWVGNDCCKWTGVVCSRSSRHVIKLKLRNQHLSNSDGDGAAYALGGEISTSLLDLKHLNYLDLSWNNFSEIPIPNFIGSLKTLRYLNLSGASFVGPIPPHLGNLSSLRYLDLNSYFSESVGNELNWLSGLSSLKLLNLGSVDLSNAKSYWAHAVNMLPSLSELHLPSCGLSTLPLSLSPVNLTFLSVLDLSNNDFNSSIPSWLFNLSSLVHLDLRSNNLEGEVIDEFSRLNFLQHLDLSDNSFIGGKMSGNLGKLCNLRMLDLSFNKISGDIREFSNGLAKCNNICNLLSLDLGYNNLGGLLPDSLGYLRNLRSLKLWGNSFFGSIPESIGNLSSLEEFYLSDNQMKGSIPVSLGQLSALVALDISHNQWEGIITEAHLSNLTSLKELSIIQTTSNITLVFSISPDWRPLFKLRFLDLKACLVGPNFPEWLRNQDELIHVAIWHANISDTIPDWFWRLDLFLAYLDFSYNQLTGTVPNTIRFRSQSAVFLNSNRFTGPLPVFSSNVSSFHLDNNLFSGEIPVTFGESFPLLTDLDISYNSLSGTIPLSMSKLSSLLTFVVSNNQLTGNFPEIWNSLPYVYLIDVSNNSLSGNMPMSLGSLSILKFLRVSNNKLSGELPSALQNCTLLETLDLGHNRLSGKIPAWIGEKLPSLFILSMPSNFFNGEIPVEICMLSSLHILDLAQNKLSGHISNCVGNLRGMTTVIAAERYEGQLRLVTKGREFYYGSTLYLVNSIDLSSNNLSGEMPNGLMDLSRLISLNLSMNHLTGTIPINIGKLQLLETLDLSSNNLSGAIPSSMASITMLNHLNLSYNNLSGKIPLTNQFQTFIDPSIFEGNPALCGLPLPTKCNGDRDETLQTAAAGNKDVESGDEHEMMGFYVSMGLGFIVGLWGVLGTLIVKKSLRHAYFKFIDDMKEKLIVFFLVNLAHQGR